MTNIFLDTEFTGLRQNTSLISLALIADDERSLYIESNNYDHTLVDDWIAENVINNLFILKQKHFEDCSVEFGYAVGYLNNPLQWNDGRIVYAENDYSVKDEIVSWLSPYEEVQIISDCSSYDWGLFCELFGGALDLSKYISSYCHDINQDIAKYINESYAIAFDFNREKLAFSGDQEKIALAKSNFATSMQFTESTDFLSATQKEVRLARLQHNPLWNAYVMKLCFDQIKAGG